MVLGMDLDIDQFTPIPILVIPPEDRFLVPADQVPVPRLQRMHRHECSSADETNDPSAAVIDTFSSPVLASPFRAG